MKNIYKKIILNILAISAAFVFVVFSTFAVSKINKTFNEWDQLTAEDLNNIVWTINALVDAQGTSVPAWAIMAFNKYDCPAGWRASDGWDWTIDLRWVFLRWMENFWTWEHNRDPDRGWRWTLWSIQGFAMQRLTWTVSGIAETFTSAQSNATWSFVRSGSVSAPMTPSRTDWSPAWSFNFDSARQSSTSSETRPINAAVLYCQKM